MAIERGMQQLGLDVRGGLHIGECEVIGEKLSGIWWPAQGFGFAPAGTHALKGLPGDWALCAGD